MDSFENHKTPFDLFLEVVVKFQGTHNSNPDIEKVEVSQFLTRLINTISDKFEYNKAELEFIFWVLANFQTPTHLLRIVLHKLWMKPENIPISHHHNYLAACVALVEENLICTLSRSEYRLRLREYTTYIFDLLFMFDWNSQYVDEKNESVQEYIMRSPHLSKLTF